MKAVFLDRDGTVVVERGYITVPDAIELVPGAATAIARLRAAGWKVFIVTNQGCIAKGLITEEELEAIHLRMVAMLAEGGATLDGIFYCPHHPDGEVAQYAEECDCRKPRPGMLERAARENGLLLADCVMVGDTLRDVEAAHASGARAVLVRTGHGERTLAENEAHGAEHVAQDLLAAVDWILSR
jgi:D-glycero-D-manno-heptose 1,7-bisphosphate phosphatase